MHSHLLREATIAVQIAARHTNFNSNSCECRCDAPIQKHVVVNGPEKGSSAVATGNHCLESIPGHTISIDLRGVQHGLATSNITTSPVVAATVAANIQGVPL